MVIKKIFGAMILVPVIIVLAHWGVNLVSNVLTGEVNVVDLIVQHKLLVTIIVAYLALKFINPFKK